MAQRLAIEDAFAALCANFRALEFVEQAHTNILGVIVGVRNQGGTALQYTPDQIEEQGNSWGWEPGPSGGFTDALRLLGIYVQNDVRLLFKMWTIWSRVIRGASPARELQRKPDLSNFLFGDLAYTLLQMLSNRKLLYDVTEVDTTALRKRYLELSQPPELIEHKTVGELFAEKVFMGAVSVPLFSVRKEDLRPDDNDWIEQMMPPRQWLEQQQAFWRNELSAAERAAATHFKEHSFEVRRAMTLFSVAVPLSAKPSETAAALEQLVARWTAWIDAPLIIDAFFNAVPNVDTERLAHHAARLKDSFGHAPLPQAMINSVNALFLDLRPAAQTNEAAFVRRAVHDMHAFLRLFYSQSALWDTLLSDPARRHFQPELLFGFEADSTDFLDAQQVLVARDNVLSDAVGNSNAWARLQTQALIVTWGFAKILKQLREVSETAMHLVTILRKEKLPVLTTRPILTYRFMQHSLNFNEGAWLWDILEQLDRGDTAVHFDPAVQSTTFNPWLMTNKWMEPNWNVLLSILCPVNSRLFFVELASSSGSESEIMIPPATVLYISHYRVLPNLMYDRSGTLWPGDWLVVLYCTMRV